MSTSKPIAYVKVSRPSIRDYDEDDDLSDLEDAQSISGSNIDPAKLAALLRIKFGAGTYDIHLDVKEEDEDDEWLPKRLVDRRAARRFR
ncbi:hypothetical protein J4E86_003980 [Alternaria arbusti]|uniref:uncharacterized protein n=1 Tax=Alternaria arbusti TaxID=232088 RepID=UPI00221FD8CA|nr:uncharacterized protein J4E86_003980 [Alternaria arbusti]KAI4958380.1 hypothetical protein J4E86_003980 [Alternaria arbusti]